MMPTKVDCDRWDRLVEEHPEAKVMAQRIMEIEKGRPVCAWTPAEASEVNALSQSILDLIDATGVCHD